VARLLIGLIQVYRMTFSLLIGRSCRFLPTCSEYAIEAIKRHGAARGSVLALKRVGRCHPWGGSGFDPVPPPENNPGRK
jgi:uncharacterized protein